MNIDEAVTNLECLEQSEEANLEDDEKQAIRLGIGALKRIKDQRLPGGTLTFFRLPGETR